MQRKQSIHWIKIGHLVIDWFLALTSLRLRITCCANEISLHGSGATFPSEVYEAWMPVFQYERSRFVEVRNQVNQISDIAYMHVTNVVRLICDCASSLIAFVTSISNNVRMVDAPLARENHFEH